MAVELGADVDGGVERGTTRRRGALVGGLALQGVERQGRLQKASRLGHLMLAGMQAVDPADPEAREAGGAATPAEPTDPTAVIDADPGVEL